MSGSRYLHLWVRGRWDVCELDGNACSKICMVPVCAICHSEMVDPAVGGGCTHHFCFVCYAKWHNRNRSCPTCRAPVHAILLDREFAHAAGCALSTVASTAVPAKRGAAPTMSRVAIAGQTVRITAPVGIVLANAEGGCRVTKVVVGNGAHRAGLRKDDVVRAINGAPVREHAAAIELMESQCRAGDCEVSFTRRTLTRGVLPLSFAASVSRSGAARSNR